MSRFHVRRRLRKACSKAKAKCVVFGVEATQTFVRGGASINFDLFASSFSVGFSNFSNSAGFGARTFIFRDLDFSPKSIISDVTFTNRTGSFNTISFTNDGINHAYFPALKQYKNPNPSQ